MTEKAIDAESWPPEKTKTPKVAAKIILGDNHIEKVEIV